jgi:hypothetical protein
MVMEPATFMSEGNSALPLVGITADITALTEGAFTTVTITRNGDITGDLAIDLGLGFGPDLKLSDFVLSGETLSTSGNSATVVIPAGQDTTTLIFTAADDRRTETLETFTFNLLEGATYTVDTAASTATLGIEANDPTTLPQGILDGQAMPRVFAFTDIEPGGETDDSLAMAFFMLMTNLFDVEGLVASKDGSTTFPEQIETIVDLYETDYPNLITYDRNYPTPEELRRIIRGGSPTVFDPNQALTLETISPGARLLIEQAHQDDARPLNVLLWGGATEVAQAIQADPSIIPKIRVYMNGSPDLYNDTNIDPVARDFLFDQAQTNGLYFAEFRDQGNPATPIPRPAGEFSSGQTAPLRWSRV